MAFTWILGRRFQPDQESPENEASGPHQQTGHEPSQSRHGPINLTDVKLSIEDGLVMVFGPEGDPVPPHLLKDACAGQPRTKLRLPNGAAVDHDRLIRVLEAQQRHPLAESKSDGWLEAMLGVAGAFEPTPSELLAEEDFESRRQPGGSLTLDVTGGETLTICDRHPGNAEGGPHVQLRIDDQIVSIDDVLVRSGRAEAGGGMSSMRLETSEDQEPSVILSMGGNAEALLEAASDVWAGQPKAALFLSDGRPISAQDLAVLLQDEAPSYSRLEKGSVAHSYPLLSADEPAFDLEQASIIMVTDLPDGWWLTSGMQSEQGAWILDPPDLSATSVHVAGPHEGPVSLNIKVISIVGHDGTLVKQSRAIVMPPIGHGAAAEATSPAKQLGAKTIDGAQSSATPLTLAPAEQGLAQGADAFLLRGLPNDMSLSAGTYDPSIRGWILKPSQLDSLTILDVDDSTKEIVIELTAIHLEGNGQSSTEAVAKKTIIIGGKAEGPEKMIA